MGIRFRENESDDDEEMDRNSECRVGSGVGERGRVVERKRVMGAARKERREPEAGTEAGKARRGPRDGNEARTGRRELEDGREGCGCGRAVYAEKWRMSECEGRWRVKVGVGLSGNRWGGGDEAGSLGE